MKKQKLLFTLVILLFVNFSGFSQSTLYPGITEINRNYSAPFVSTPPVIDGIIDDVWDQAAWMSAQTYFPITGDWPAGTTPEAPAGAFSGESDASFKYKIVWDDNHYYMLMRWTDDVVIYSDNHTGYSGSGVNALPPWNQTFTAPAVGEGDGTGYHNWRMDHISLWMTVYNEAYFAVNSYNRTSNGLMHGFYPGYITQKVHDDAVLWGAKHSGAVNHRATVAGRYDAIENAYYIEFRDTTWAHLWDFISTVDLPGYVPAAGDRFLLAGEVNDADSNTNRRDYNLSLAANTSRPTHELNEAVVVVLTKDVTSVPASQLRKDFHIYPNPNSGDVLRLNRVADVEIFNLAGQRIISSVNTREINISSLQAGVYMVKDNEGNVRKLVKK